MTSMDDVEKTYPSHPKAHPAFDVSVKNNVHKFIQSFHKDTGLYVEAHNLPLLHAMALPVSTMGQYLKKIGGAMEKAETILVKRKMPDNAETWGTDQYNLLFPKYWKEFQESLQAKYKDEIKTTKYSEFIKKHPNWPPHPNDIKEFYDTYDANEDSKKKKKNLNVPLDELPIAKQLKKLGRLKRNIMAEIQEITEKMDAMDESSDEYKDLKTLKESKVSYTHELHKEMDKISATAPETTTTVTEDNEDTNDAEDTNEEEEAPKPKTRRRKTAPTDDQASGSKRVTRAAAHTTKRRAK